jgi:hypothetical protein
MSSASNNNSDEIDLSQLFKLISNGVSNFFEKIINLFAYVRRVTIDHIKFIATLSTVTVILVIGYNIYVQKDIYGSSMLVRSTYLNNQLVENTIFKLNSLAHENDKSTLSQVLKIDVNIANQITGFEFEPFVTEEEKLEIELLKEKLTNLKVEDEIVKSISDKIKIRNPNTFKITVLTKTNNVVYALDSAIANYFLKNSYISKRIEANRTTLINRKAKLEKEQFKMDSLKRTIFEIYQSISKSDRTKGSDNVILAGQEVTNPLEVFKEDLIINDAILAIDRQLFLKNEFEVIEGLTPFSKPISISLFKLTAYTALSGIGISYLLLMLIGLNRFFANRENQ